MTRYTDIDKLIAEYDRVHIGPPGGARKLMEDAPIADVVPRDEYEALIYKLECLLCHATGGKLSKHTYDLRTMETVVNDYINESCDEGFEALELEVAREIFEEIEEEICAALDSNYKALRTYDDGRNNDYILELVGRIKGKIDALRGIEAFVEDLKEKYTKGGESDG